MFNHFARFGRLGSLSVIVVLTLGSPPSVLGKEVIAGIADGILNKEFFKLVGPPDACHISKDGMTFSLSSASHEPYQVGVMTKSRVVGDFTVTGGYELVTDEKPESGTGAGVMLRIVWDTAKPHQKATLARLHLKNEKVPAVYRTSLFTVRGSDTNYDHHNKLHSAKSRSGRLRLERKGATLHYQVAEGDAKVYQEIRTENSGNEDILNIDLVGITGGSTTPLTMRLTDFSIECDRYISKSPRQSQAKWFVWIASGISIVVAAIVIGVSIHRWQTRFHSANSHGERGER